MSANDANPDKTSGYDPATVELDDGRIIDAAHHITNDRAKLLHLYIRGRDGGIDVTIPLADSDVTAYAQSDLGREVLGLDTDDEQDADGDNRLAADGGRDVPSCTCGADLVRTAELTTAEAPVAGARYPAPPIRTVPDAECTNCGRSVGAVHGTEAALAVWEVRCESPPGDDDDDRRVFRVGAGGPPVFDDDADEDDDRLVADGGRDAVKFAEDVDYVEYDGNGYLVYGAVTREKLEICQVNKRPITVPVDECTPTDVRGTPLNDNGERLVTDGGVPGCGGHVNQSQANTTLRDLIPRDADGRERGDIAGEDTRSDDAGDGSDDIGECDNPLCNDDASDIECRRGGVYCSTECRAVVNEARCAADARRGYDSLLMPTGDREDVGAVLAALNVNDAIDTGGD